MIFSTFTLYSSSSSSYALPLRERVQYIKNEESCSASKSAKEAARKVYNYMKQISKEVLKIEVDSKTLTESYASPELIGILVKSKDGYQVGFIEDLLIGKNGEAMVIISRSFPLGFGEPIYVLFIGDSVFSSMNVFELNLSREEFKERPTVKVKL